MTPPKYPPRLASRTPWGAFLTLAALTGASLLLFHGLGRQTLWSDEAETALLARNWLRYGELTAWNGKNVVAFDGGRDLNEYLVNDYMPPQQYYLAALGITLFGDSTTAVRAPFAAIGLLTLFLVAWWAGRFFDASFPRILPAILLVFSPAYLLLMRNARYYAPGILWTVLLFALWTAVATRRRSIKKSQTPLYLLATAVATLIVVFALFTSQYIYGATALAALPVLFLDERFRSRGQLVLLGIIYAAGIVCILAAVFGGNAADTLFERRPGIGAFLRSWLVISWRSLRDMGLFELFAWPLLLPLALPWSMKKLAASRLLALRALILLGALFVCLVAAGFLSPQTFHGTQIADMRYVFPLLILGAMITSASLVILWRLHPGVALAAGGLLIATNIFYLGAHRSQKRHTYYAESTPVRSTLVDYLRERLNPAHSTAAKLNEFLAQLPQDTAVWLHPAPLATASIYTLPNLRYCGLLDPSKALNPELRATLPPYLFPKTASPDVLAILVSHFQANEDGSVKFDMVDPGGKEFFESTVNSGAYKTVALIPSYGWDETRPEIPWHLFYEPPEGTEPGFVLWILRRGPPASQPPARPPQGEGLTPR